MNSGRIFTKPRSVEVHILPLFTEIEKNYCFSIIIHTQWSQQHFQKETITVFPVKPWTPEKISGMFIVSRPIRCEMKPQNITDKPQNGLITTSYETTSLLFLHEVSLILLFSNTETFLSLFQLCCHQRIDITKFYGKAKLIKKTGSDTARQRVWDKTKWANHKQCFSVFVIVSWSNFPTECLIHLKNTYLSISNE